ncbi:MAG: M1 family peptidase, partial [Chloroflexota bacterium]
MRRVCPFAFLTITQPEYHWCMSNVYNRPGRWMRPVWLLFGLAILAAFLLAAFIFVKPLRSFAETQSYLNRQGAAMKPGFRYELWAMDQAPRYSLVVTVDPENGIARGEMTVQYFHSGQSPVSELAFRLLPNAQAVYGGGLLSIERITQDGLDLLASISEDQSTLWVSLPQPLSFGDSAAIRMEFTSQAPFNSTQGYGIFNQSSEMLTLAGWYPILAVYRDGWIVPTFPTVGDAIMAETSLYDVQITLPQGYQLVSTGTVISRKTGDSSQVRWHIKSGPVREFAAAISNKFEVRERTVSGTVLRSYTLPAENPVTGPDECLKMMEDAFRVYQQRFGPYPYKELEMVEAAVNIGGFEFSGMVYVDDELRTNGQASDYRYLLAHELAHQWWYGLVGNNTIQEPWLDEAHAAYAAVIYLEQVDGPEAGEALIQRWESNPGLREPGQPPVNSSALDFSDWTAYRDSIYTHGALFIDQLRKEMGDEAFFRFLLRYQEEYRYQIATSDDYFKLAEEI